MYTPTYIKFTADNVDTKNANYFMLNLEGPNPGRLVQTVVTNNTGDVTYTVYVTAFGTQGKQTRQPYSFDVTDLKYWTILGTQDSSVNQFLTIPAAATGVWIIASSITNDATLEVSISQPGLQ